MTPAEYDDAVATLAAFARLHRFALPHPHPPRECPTCAAIDRRRRELAASCPA